MSCLMTFLSTGLIYTLLYDSARKSPQKAYIPNFKILCELCVKRGYFWRSWSQSPQTNFHRLHQFIFSFCLITFELFWTSIPIRIYHVIYCWVSHIQLTVANSILAFVYPFKPIIGLYSGILYWKNEDEEKHSKFPLFTSTGQNDANIHDVTLLCIVTFVISTGVYLLIFSCSLCKWSCIANTQE